jgi:PAS domain S-box-containing protein
MKRKTMKCQVDPKAHAGVRLIGAVQDIAERNRAEEALAKSEALLREAQGAAHIGHWELDTSIMTPAWSEEVFHIFGLDPEEEEPSFEAHQKATHPDDWGILNNAVTTSIVEGIPFDIEFRILRPDKTVRWIHAIGYPKKDGEGRIVSVFGTAQDITDKKLLVDALRVSLEKYRVLFESFPLGITISDKSGKIIESNRQSEQLLGLPREAHAQRRIDDKGWPIIRKDGTPMPADEYASIRALRENRLIKNVEMGIVKDKGEITWIDVTAAPIPLEGYGVAIAYGDITERLSAEQARKRAEEALRKSESQLRALSLELLFVEERERKRLALYLHDEIGQSLALLGMKLGGLAGVRESRSRKQNIQQMRDLLQKAIDQTHALTFELSPPVLHQLGLEAAIEWAGEKLGQDFGTEFKFSDDGMIKPLSADTKTLLFRCVRELMSNTVKHAKAKRMTVSLKRTQNQFTAVVEDNGIGFDTSLLERQQDMVGFGLLSVREHIGAVGGSYELHSESGRGTRITLSVPLKEEMPSS